MRDTSDSLTRIKVCGLTRNEDVALAVELGAWALGFIFYEKSPRFVQPEAVGKILAELRRKSDPLRVGIFVNPSLETLKEVVETAQINAIQLHGEETPEFCEQVKGELDFLKVFKALKLKSPEDLQSLQLYKDCDGILLDSYSESLKGGTGTLSRWDLARKAVVDRENLPPIILAGGLNEDNVKRAFEEVRPWAVDVSSGLEISPGVKSPAKMMNFFKRSRP